MLATATLGLLASFAYAGPSPQYFETLRHQSQFNQLKPGDMVAYVCNECKTVSEIPIESTEQAMALCKEGATVTCPVCKIKAKVRLKSQSPENPTGTVVTYVNDKGEECAFVAKVAESK